MRKWLWATLLALPLAVAGGLVYANSQRASAEGYTCPITGEELPCPKRCPLNEGKWEAVFLKTSVDDPTSTEVFLMSSLRRWLEYGTPHRGRLLFLASPPPLLTSNKDNRCPTWEALQTVRCRKVDDEASAHSFLCVSALDYCVR